MERVAEINRVTTLVSVKRAYRPDSVRVGSLATAYPWPPFLWAEHHCPARATYPPARAVQHFDLGRRSIRVTPAYLVLLRVEIARFTRPQLAFGTTRLCCSDPHLAVDSRWLLRRPVQSGPSSSATK